MHANMVGVFPTDFTIQANPAWSRFAYLKTARRAVLRCVGEDPLARRVLFSPHHFIEFQDAGSPIPIVFKQSWALPWGVLVSIQQRHGHNRATWWFVDRKQPNFALFKLWLHCLADLASVEKTSFVDDIWRMNVLR